MEYNLSIRRGRSNRGRENRRDFTLFLPHFICLDSCPVWGTAWKLQEIFQDIQPQLCPDSICRDWPDFTPQSLLERATPPSQEFQGMLLGFQGYDKPRSLIQAEAALQRLPSPGPGTAWVGGCCPQELSRAVVPLPLSLIIRTQGRVTVPPSRQRARH